MADIFREVDEEVRQERLNELWKKYGPWLIGAAVVIVVATAGVTGWRQYSLSQRLSASDKFNAAVAMAAADRAGAEKALAALASDAPEPYATLARMREAGLRASAGDKTAAAVFDEVVRTTSDTDLKELAKLLSAVQGISTDPPDTVAAKLKPLAADGQPWHGLARDYLAALAYKKGDVAGARTIWEQIAKDVSSSAQLKARAEELLAATGGVTPPQTKGKN